MSGIQLMVLGGSGGPSGFIFTISSNQTNANLATLATSAGWDGTKEVTATVGTGVYIYSTSTGTPGLTVPNSFPNGVKLINNGYILGMGGSGTVNSTGSAGGNAINLSTNITITNNSYIAGGGGGGGSDSRSFNDNDYGNNRCSGGGGGGAGGGAGVNGSNGPTANGGAGGGVGSSGSTGSTVYTYSGGIQYAIAGGGGGGRILPGTGGSGVTPYLNAQGGGGGGAGGAGGGGQSGGAVAVGGGGGGWGASGGSAATATGNNAGVSGDGGSSNGGGGTAYIPGGYWPSTNAGGAGGKCINLNGNTATFLVNGNRYGAIS